MRKLAFDLGSKSLGIAISDASNIIAIGLENFVFKDYDLEAIINKINSLLKKYKIDLIIFGIPTFASGELVENAKWILKVIDHIKKNNKLIYTPKIITINENKTTKEALNILKEAGLTRKKQKLKKDQLAAQLILQSYLDFNY